MRFTTARLKKCLENIRNMEQTPPLAASHHLSSTDQSLLGATLRTSFRLVRVNVCGAIDEIFIATGDPMDLALINTYTFGDGMLFDKYTLIFGRVRGLLAQGIGMRVVDSVTDYLDRVTFFTSILEKKEPLALLKFIYVNTSTSFHKGDRFPYPIAVKVDDWNSFKACGFIERQGCAIFIEIDRIEDLAGCLSQGAPCELLDEAGYSLRRTEMCYNRRESTIVGQPSVELDNVKLELARLINGIQESNGYGTNMKLIDQCADKITALYLLASRKEPQP